MRIACIHIPQFALQCTTRLDPAQRGAAVAVVSTTAPASGAHGDVRMSVALHAPIVVACSRAAWAAGVRLGMTATAVRQLGNDTKIVVTSVDAAIERETVRAIAEAVLGLTGVVDLGGRAMVNERGAASGAGSASSGAHLAMYAEVPAKTRGHAFGERVLERLEELGLTGRVGIADDRFTAWVAAAHDGAGTAGADRVTMVPRGGSAAFLAPRPLSLLAISNEVQHMLEALGVRTLGEFAALPAPSVRRSRSGPPALEADYQALARGESGTLLRPYAPEAAIREDIVVHAGNVLDAPVAGSSGDASVALSGPSAIALVARRLALRLAGRGRVAAKLELVRTATGPSGAGTDRFETAVTLSPPTAAAEDLARVLAPSLDGAGTEWRLRVVVVGEALAGEVDQAGRALFTLSQELGMPTVELAMAGRQVAAAATRAATIVIAPPANQDGPLFAVPALASFEDDEPPLDSAASASPLVAVSAVAQHPASRAGESLATAGRTATPQVADPLSIVLSTSGSLFALSSPGSPQSERRELRGRLRRGKARVARRGRAVTLPGQSRLFERG